MKFEREVQKLTFYIAIIVYESSSDAPGYQKLYEENYVLVKASSDEDAQQKALQKEVPLRGTAALPFIP